jgi:hypothetical protein
LEAPHRALVALAAHLSVDGELQHPALLRGDGPHPESPVRFDRRPGAQALHGYAAIIMMSAPEAHKIDIINSFRTRLSSRAGLSDFRVDDDQVQISFKGPGYSADGFIDRHSGKYDLNENRLGFVAIINDLHKGRDTGKVWAAIIDISAILMVLLSLSGLVLIFFLHKKLRSGLIALAAGTVLCYVVYQIWVP